ncbi:AraC family transcriptional regulator [Alistipes putredinis]|uniref:AraC family transcriptional regulator n=1 Tax=Alistipes putredinis TaxID=28117 RepID=UPI0024AE8246|nr:AraC family transcriptional regulator [Alistipes putredinis]
MPLHNKKDHTGCVYYATDESALFRQYRLSDSTDISDINESRSVLLYLAEGCLQITLGNFTSRTIEQGVLVFLPKNIGFIGQTIGSSYFIASFFAGRLPLCNKYDLVDLQYQVRQRNGRHLPPPSRQFPQLAVCKELVAFYSDLSHNLNEGLNCLHFHRLKQEELCILLRGYYSLEELYILLKSVIGNSDNFKDFVLENYQHVNDVSDFALLAHMSVRNFQRKFKEEFKWPVREWLNERRAERILRDIRNTDKSIAEIATSYGFATASYFTVFCKQYFGMTPSELRRRSKQTATKCRE